MTQASWTTSFFTPCQSLEIREIPNPYYKRKKKTTSELLCATDELYEFITYYRVHLRYCNWCQYYAMLEYLAVHLHKQKFKCPTYI